jgi:murein DD-endopeptidase MepM/ murein hydrolase activator NlpD
MDIIFVAARSGKVRTIHASKRMGVVAAVIGCALLTALLAPLHVPPAQIGIATQYRVNAAQQSDHLLVRESLGALSETLGTLQAKLVRLEAHGDHLARLAGLSRPEFRFSETRGRGGPFLERVMERDPIVAMEKRLAEFAIDIEDRSDKLALLDHVLQERRVEKKREPTIIPVASSAASSNFGNRIDPFTGQLAFHAGVDFVAQTGTNVVAAASGVVATAEFHAEYGNLIEIDHGNGLLTRYGHASMLFAKVGDIVMQGQRIAAVGSTGRSTGPHLHFEVRDNGSAINPAKYLQPDK